MSTAARPHPPAQNHWRFPTAFWTANVIELFERGAYYSTYIFLTVFLTDIAGFTDQESGWIAGLFAAFIYLLPLLLGAAADRIGYRRALLLAFSLLTAGYLLLGLHASRGLVALALLLIVVGGGIVKPVITGTAARSSSSEQRARAFSIFYMMVNIGSFTGKALVKPFRTSYGIGAIPLMSAVAAAVAFGLVSFFYFPKEPEQQQADLHPFRVAKDTLRNILTVLRNRRFLAIILITAGFWAIQGQLYASMPKYVLRMVGQNASPEWYANINPLMVIILVVPITQLCRRIAPVLSIAICMALIPLSALSTAYLPQVLGPLHLGGRVMHPITVAVLVGIAIQGLAECFLSPRYYEYASHQAPRGQEALYMGSSQVNSFFANLLGFGLSGYLLQAFCPDPRTLSAADQTAYQKALAGQGPMPAAYAHAHYLWFVFAAIGVSTFVMLILFHFYTQRLDKKPR